MTNNVLGTWIHVNKGGTFPDCAVKAKKGYFYVCRCSSKPSFGFGKALLHEENDPKSGAVAWFPFEKKEHKETQFEVLVYKGTIVENGYEFYWKKLVKILQHPSDHEVYRENGFVPFEMYHKDYWAIGKLKWPSVAYIPSGNKEHVYEGKHIENGYALCFRKVSKVVIELIPESITPAMAKRKPASYLEGKYTTSLLPQEYTFRKNYKVVQASTFEISHGWSTSVEISLSTGLLTESVAKWQKSLSVTMQGNYVTTQETTKEEETEFTYPIKVPPYTTSTITATIWQEQLDIPFLAKETIYDQFNHVIKEHQTKGVWHGVSCYVADVNIQETFRKGFLLMIIVILGVLFHLFW